MRIEKFILAVAAGSLSLAASAAEPVLMAKPVPFIDASLIAGNIKRECTIQDQLADYINEYAREHRIEVRFAAEVEPNAAAQVLDVRICESISQGNPFIGHRKSTTAVGKLSRDGALVASFTARRDSMGGMFAGYKGSCSVLGRTVKALGKDIAAWLLAPSMDAQLGDLG